MAMKEELYCFFLVSQRIESRFCPRFADSSYFGFHDPLPYYSVKLYRNERETSELTIAKNGYRYQDLYGRVERDLIACLDIIKGK